MLQKATSRDPTALVTGASRGLGAAIAARLGTSGYHVIAVARTVGGLEAVDDRIRAGGGAATLAPLDITDDGAMQHLCRSVHDRWGGLDLWAHPAVHAAPLAPIGSIDARDLERSLAVNVTAAARMMRYAEPLLAARGGVALLFDDAQAGGKFFGAYGASKAAQIALARSWQAETLRTGPTVRILSPPPMPTATRARFFPGEDRGTLTAPDDAASALLDGLIA